MAKEGGTGVAIRAVLKHSWSEEDGAVYSVVQMFRVEIIGGGVVICPTLLRQSFCGFRFDLVEIEES